MKAAVLYKLFSSLVIEEELELPQRLEVGQVLVKVLASSICGAQIGEIYGAKGEDKYLPHLLGHEGCGVVISVGRGVTQAKKNNVVVLHWRKGKGINAETPKYKIKDKGTIIGGGWVTTFNNYAVVSENRLTVIDNDIPSDIGALMGCAVTTGLGVISNEAQLKPGQSIAIAGCGGVGLNIIQGAYLVGAKDIIGFDKSIEKLEFSEKFKTTETHLATQENIKALNNVDIFVDCTGNPQIIEAGYSIAKKTVLVGQPKYDEDLIFRNMRKNYTGKILMDSQGGLTNPNEDIPRYLNLYKAGRLNLGSLITKRIQLKDINDVIVEMREGKFLGKCIIEM